MHRLRSQTAVPCRPTPSLRPRYRTVTLMLMAALAGVALPAGAQEVPAAGAGLPLQPATLAEGAAPAGNAPAAGSAAPADEMATMVATLQKQIIAQQALLQVLQARLAAGSVPAADAAPPSAAVTPAAPASGELNAKAVPAPSSSAAPQTTASAPATPPAGTGQAPSVNGGQTPPSGTGSAPGAAQDGALSVSPTASAPERAAPSVTAPAVDPAPAHAPDLGATAVPATPTGSDITLSTQAQRQAYASGASVWREIQSSIASQHALGIELDARYVMAGLQDMALNQPLKMSADEMDSTMSSLNTDYIRRANEARQHQEAEGKAFRIAFSKQKGSYSDAGAWYRIDDRGQGSHLKTTDMAVLQVTGTLPDGTVFDASGQQGRTRTVKVGSLLPSVAIGLQKVAPGGRLTVVVPPQKGYGDAGLPPSIPGGATLIFDITVKGVSRGE